MKLTVVARQLWHRFDESVGNIGITRAQWSLIAAVARNPGATQRIVASVLQVTDVTAGRLIDRLCSDGYLERRPHPQDGRAHCVYITPAARPLLDRLSEVATAREEETFRGISQEDLDHFEEVLDQISQNIADIRSRPPAKNGNFEKIAG